MSKSKEYKQPSWIHAGPNLTYKSLDEYYREYLETKVRIEKYGECSHKKITPEVIIDHALEFWLHESYIVWEARGFYLARSGGGMSPSTYPITEGDMFNLWFFREMHKKMVELNWLDDPSSESEFFSVLGWERS